MMGVLLTKTGRNSIFEIDKGDEWVRGKTGYDHDEDGFSDQATQGTEADEEMLKSPFEEEMPLSPRASMSLAGGLRASVRRLGLVGADLVDG